MGIIIIKKTNNINGFTIVELLVVIVIIGILASITTISYSGISKQAAVSSLQLELKDISKQLKVFYADNNVYPTSTSTDCTASPTTATNLCIKAIAGNVNNTITYSNPTPHTFIITGVNGNNTYHITDKTPLTAGIYAIPTLATTDPANWLAIGTQIWAKYNLNVGTMVTWPTSQTNNGGTNVVEKYCYNNLESNCITYGALYQWNEAMQYVITEGTQGVCPAGSHIPTDNDWKILEVQLGMATGSDAGQVDATGWRGTDQGTKLKPGGTSGLNIPLAGYGGTDGSFGDLSSGSFLWSSLESTYAGRARYLSAIPTNVGRGDGHKDLGFSVRCVGN